MQLPMSAPDALEGPVRGLRHGLGVGPVADDHDDRLLNKVSRDSAR